MSNEIEFVEDKAANNREDNVATILMANNNKLIDYAWPMGIQFFDLQK